MSGGFRRIGLWGALLLLLGAVLFSLFSPNRPGDPSASAPNPFSRADRPAPLPRAEELGIVLPPEPLEFPAAPVPPRPAPEEGPPFPAVEEDKIRELEQKGILVY